MRFLVDAQLPARLARFLAAEGYDSVRTTGLPAGNRTTDEEIAALADEEGRVVITKDSDFRDSHLLRGTPRRLLVVRTGNISNDDLVSLFTLNLKEIVATLDEARLLELRPDRLIIHADRVDNP